MIAFHKDGTVKTQQFDDAVKQLEDVGFTASAGSWENEHMVCVFSVETHGPATYNHPKKTIQVNK